jgi:hypothetical protein
MRVDEITSDERCSRGKAEPYPVAKIGAISELEAL